MILPNEVTDTIMMTVDQLQSSGGIVAGVGVITFNEHYGFLTSGGLLSLFIYTLLMVGMAFFFYRHEKALSWCDRYLTYAFVAVWALGFVVYDVGMYPDHSSDGNAIWALLGVAPMAIIHAFEMFILQSDVSAIHDGCHDSAWYMFFFSIAHLLAAFISMVFVIKHFGFNIVANCIRIIKTYFWPSAVENLYVFWGMNDATYYLAKDIIHQTNQLSNARIVIIRVNNNDKDTMGRIGMDRLFSFLSLTSNNLENLQELQKQGCLTCSTFGSLADAGAKTGSDLLRHDLRLNSVVQLMKRTTGKVRMFFLNDDERFNIMGVSNLKCDASVADYAKRGKIKFYCNARYNSIHRLIEDEPMHENIEVQVIDTSHISVELLKRRANIHLQPVSYVDVQPDATVSSPFNAMVIGLSEVGLDMVRFLYEFGAFVKQGSTSEHVVRSDFHCYVVDKEMQSLAGTFFSSTPSIRPVLDPKDETQTSSSLISLHHMDCRSVEFYRHLAVWLPDLNYIVVSTDDDELNISHAVRLFRLAIRSGADMSRLRIMVRVHNDENGHFRQIAQNYNRQWKAEYAVPGNRLNQNVIDVNQEVDGPITLFGEAKDVYTYRHIIDEELKVNAKVFKAKYDKSLHDLQVAAKQTPQPIITWDEQQNRAMQLTGENKGKSPTYSGVMKLRRTQSQNFANSLHTNTKIELALKALDEQQREMMRQHGIVRDVGKTSYRWKDGTNAPFHHIQRVLETLAQTEHLRWVASHQLLGYQKGDNLAHRDEARLRLGYMCDWGDLPEDVRSYDYNAVDISLTYAGFYGNQEHPEDPLIDAHR